MARRKVNKTDPRNVAKPVSQLRGAAKQARISRVTKAEAGPATVRGGMAPGAGRSKPIGTPSPGAQARAAAQGKALRRAAETRRTARATSQRMEKVLKAAKVARQIAGAAGALARGGVAAAVMAPRPAGDGTLSAAMKRGDYKPQQGPKPATTQASFNKKTFDQAFKSARTSGAKQFTWRGKKYTTKIKGE